jgi:ribosomal protein L35
MSKKKTKKSAMKRFRRTRNGKIIFTRPGRGHLLTCKRRKRKQDLRNQGTLSHADEARLSRMLVS